MTISLLATGAQQAGIANRYMWGKSTVCKIFSETCTAIWDVLSSEYVKFPTENDFKRIAQDFWKVWNFPLCLGAIDGKLVKIRAPPNSGSIFYSYKGEFDILFLACVDASYRFTMIDVGAYGSEGDPGVFSRSAFGKKFCHASLTVLPQLICPG